MSILATLAGPSRLGARIVRRLGRRTGDWSVSRKLLALMGLMCAFIVISAVVLGGGMVVTRSAMGEVRYAAEMNADIGRAGSAIAMAHGRVKDYVIDPTPQNASAVQNELAAAQTALSSLRELSKAKDIDARLSVLDTHLEHQRETFREIRASQEKILDRIAPRIDDIGPAIGQDLAGIVAATYQAGNYSASNKAAKALNSYSESRIDVNRFRSSGEPDAIASARANLVNLEDALNELYLLVGQDALVAETDGVIAQVVDFDGAFRELVSATETRDRQVNRLIETIGPAFESDLSSLSDLNDRQFSRATDTAVFTMDLTLTAMTVAGVLAVLVMMIGYGCARVFIERPITRLAAKMMRLAGGERDIVIGNTARGDEIGEMSRAVVIFAENAREIERQRDAAAAAERRERDAAEARRAERIAAREQADLEKKKALQELANSFESSIHTVAEAISGVAKRIETEAQRVARAANQNAVVTADVAVTAEQSSQNALAVANASEEMARSIAEVSAQVMESSQRSKDAAERARRTDRIVAGLAADASKIGEVVELINSIAEQTNLLALNATIEAARAGDAGRGFAVVASEIKALASQTSKATTQIGDRVGGIQRVTSDAVRAIEEIGMAIDDIDGIAASVAAAVEQQSATTSEIASNTQQAAGGSELVARNIHDIRNGIEDTGTAAEESLMAAADLSRQAATLQQEVVAFLDRVRAA